MSGLDAMKPTSYVKCATVRGTSRQSPGLKRTRSHGDVRHLVCS